MKLMTIITKILCGASGGHNHYKKNIISLNSKPNINLIYKTN